MNNDVNLLSVSEKQEPFVPQKRLLVMRYVAMLLLFIVSGASISLFMLIALSPLPQLQLQEKSLRSALAGSHTDMATMQLLEDRVTTAWEIMKARKQYDSIIEYIMQNVSGSIKITTIRMDQDALTLTVSGSSLASLDAFLTQMIQPRRGVREFTQITLNDLITDRESNVYTMSLRFTL